MGEDINFIDWMPELLEALENGNRDAQERAIRGLGELKTARAASILVAILDNFQLSGETTRALINCGDAAIPVLVEALESRESQNLFAAIQALGAIGGDGIPPLIELLGDSSIAIRGETARVLGESKDKRAVLPVTTLLKDPDKRVRKVAVQSLDKLGSGKAIPALISALHGNDPEFIIESTRAISNLAGKGDAEPYKVAEQLKEYVDKVRKEDAGKHPRVREWAMKILLEVSRSSAGTKRAEMQKDGLLLEGTVKLPKKPPMYRKMRRISHG